MDGYFGTTLKTEDPNEIPHSAAHGRIQRGDRGSGPPMKITKIGVLCDTGPDPLPRSIHRPASETSLKWPFAGGPMMALS